LGRVAVSIGLQRRTIDRIVPTLTIPDQIRKTGRKRDANLTHHFRQRDRPVCSRTGSGAFGAALPWLAQIPAIADAGFHVVAPDMRGFGRSSAPADIGAYSIFDNVGDMVALVSALGEKQAVVVGHDWGAPVAWSAALFRPDIFTKVAGLSVPPPSRGRGLPLETLRKNGITNFYWQYFQPPGVAEAEFERDVAATMRIVLGGRGFSDPSAHQFVQEGKGFLAGADPNRPLPNWLTEADLHHLRGSLSKVRLPRRAELVSQHRSQLGADRPVAGRTNPPAVAVYRGIEGWGHYRPDRRQTGQ
jgi:pimeloyl-ACP methyl ester carboxylesterase